MNSENRTITIIVSPKGQTKIETHGFTGSVCQSASKFIEKALGKSIVERLKPTFYQEHHNSQQEYENQ